ncbi:MAG: DUF5683 domain-containing protein [Amoebophilaceae bacterium]|nr:DUF5683 domain-containing protein [Amoebophilaceae bacterium]
MHKLWYGKSERKAPVSSLTSRFVGSTSSDATPQAPLRTIATQANKKEHAHIDEKVVMQQAWMYSAILPGWGQGYNQHYWKVPVIYAGFLGLGWGALYYHKGYVAFRRELLRKKSGGNLINHVDEYRMGRDLCLIFTALWYVINVFDAYAGASLKTFTLSDDISIEVQPSVLHTVANDPTIGMSLTLSFGE